MSGSDTWMKPTIVLVPGAWNSPGSFNLLIPFLEAAGYSFRSISLPSVGADPPTGNIAEDVEAIRAVLEQEADMGSDILLLMHDYGSVPGGEAVKGLSKATRLQSGLKGGVTCLFYVASPLLAAGSCLSDVFNQAEASWIVVSRDCKVAIAERPMDVFCPEVEPVLAKEYVDTLRPHSYQTFFSRTTWEPYREIPFFCVFCKLDMVIPLEKQKALAAAADIRFRSSTLNAGHCPFLALPEDLVKSIRRAAKESTYYSGVIARDYGLPNVSHSKAERSSD